MIKFSRIFLFCLAVLVCTSKVIAAPVIGRAVAIDDTVTGDQNGQSRNLANGSEIFANQLITTNPSGLGQFEFVDGTRIVVGPNSKIILDSLVYDGAGAGLTSFVLTSAAGAIRFISGSGASSNYRIDTPIGTLGIRGTAFDLHVSGGRVYVMLLEGEVEFCARTGICKSLKRHCEFFVASPAGNVSDPVLPRNGIFSGRDMARYFPFIADQRPLQPENRLRVDFCGGGSGSGGTSGADGGNGNAKSSSGRTGGRGGGEGGE